MKKHFIDFDRKIVQGVEREETFYYANRPINLSLLVCYQIKQAGI